MKLRSRPTRNEKEIDGVLEAKLLWLVFSLPSLPSFPPTLTPQFRNLSPFSFSRPSPRIPLSFSARGNLSFLIR